MKSYGHINSGQCGIRLAEPGYKPSAYKKKEMSPEKKADIERCLSCEKPSCTGCTTTHEQRRKGSGAG